MVGGDSFMCVCKEGWEGATCSHSEFHQPHVDSGSGDAVSCVTPLLFFTLQMPTTAALSRGECL